ncbi:response regulator [Pseudoxanthomonas koreensis]|uniref:response regulator n=1 Tax=Pseudoxanthomonas koreensis TaxID=266061 RepID=UPI001390DE96|nr:response regulator [Pseudoxanthomonas koreensis]KAF1691436.1 transcriptional regulator [Pseudoxanthomonas koreensis]
MEQPDPPRMPRILLVEDDTISQVYFRAVLEGLPATVDTVATRACALARATDTRHDLWLVDLGLPDGSGIELLQQLRQRWPQPPPALAHTADADPAPRTAALQAGFRDVLVKPLATAELAGAVRAALAGAVRTALAEAGGLPDWDNAAAAAALNNDPANVQALRRLFLEELPAARAEVLASARAGDPAALRARLHRLQAGCGLAGARRLGEAVASLRLPPESGAALARFDQAAHDLLG